MSLTRLSDWQTRLDQFLTSHQYEPFQYGQWDCCLFACDAICVMTATDPAAPFRGHYSTCIGARRAIRRRTGSSSVEAITDSVTAAHEMPEVPVLRAQRGDLVLVNRPEDNSQDYSLGIIGLNGRELVVTSSQGLWRLPLSYAVRAWRI